MQLTLELDHGKMFAHDVDADFDVHFMAIFTQLNLITCVASTDFL